MTAPRLLLAREALRPAVELEVFSYAELMRNPALMQPPPVVVPRLVYAGRVTLMAGREKDGKSTFAAAAVAAISRGAPFVSEPTRRMQVLWATEEHPSEPARRWAAMRADPEWIDGLALPHTGTPEQRVEAIAEHVAGRDYELIVVDTLSVLMRGMRSHNDSAEVGNLMGPLVQMAHEQGVALLLIHHANKAEGSYRGSTEIGARVDVLADLAVGSLAHQRKVTVRGRFGTDAFVASFTGETFELMTPGDALPLELRVQEFVVRNPGCSGREIEQGVAGRATDVRSARQALVRARRIEERRHGAANRYFSHGFSSSVTPGRVPENCLGTSGDECRDDLL